MAPPEFMRCAYCNANRHTRDGFPNRTFAECWRCAWESHVAAEHKPRRRWWRKAADVDRAGDQ